MKNFLDIDNQIEENKKTLEFYYTNYQKTQGKITILTIIYSILSIYILQIFKFPFENFQKISTMTFAIYLLLLITFIIFIIWSIRFTYLLLKPVKIAYLNDPKFFYNNIRKQYEQQLNTTDEDVLSAYIKTTYLNEVELAVETNFKVMELKGNYYDTAFKKALISLMLYLSCVGFVVFEPDRPKDFNINNYQEIINYLDSNNNKPIKLITMTEENKNNQSSKENGNNSDSSVKKIKVDPKKVIKTKSRMVYENFGKVAKDDSSEKESNDNSENKNKTVDE